MGFYFRKSVRVGPLRFNFSKSGIGVSAGIPGLRVGTGPRGHYIQAGRGGFYYRATIPSDRQGDAAMRVPQDNAGPYVMPPSADPTLGPEHEIESGSVLAMRDETSDGLLRELNEKRSRLRLAPVAGGVGVLLLLLLRDSQGIGVLAAAAVLVTAMIAAAWNVDALRKTTVIMYDMQADALADFESLVAALRELAGSERIWHISSRADVRDTKYHAGATSTIKRTPTSVTSGLPQFIKCNLDVPRMSVGRQTIYFFPDRLLVYDAGTVGAVGYNTLSIDRQTTRFIEEEGVPRDSKVVGQTWRYVNKSGGPDRRFKDNRQIPICEYEAIHLSSDTGLNELLHVSRVGAGGSLIALMSRERSRLNQYPRRLRT